VQLITKKDNRAYTIHWNPRDNGCGLTASTFLRYVGFDTSETRSLPAQWDDKQQMFIIEVPEKYLKKDGSPMVRTKGHAITSKTSKIDDAKSNESLACDVCGKPCKSPLGLNSHKRSHTTNQQTFNVS
jgi:hypothetical protein